VTQEADLARREAELAERYNPGHPLLDQIQEQRASVRSAISREIGNVQASVQSQAQAARSAESQTQSNASRLRSQLDRELSATVRYRQLLREAEVRRSIYEEFAQQVGRLAQRATVQVPDAVLVAGAPISLQPVSPKPLLLVALGIVGGGAAGTAIGLLLAWRRRATVVQRQSAVSA
jgi:succinoglycan biosynthesis transport protein ExoP